MKEEMGWEFEIGSNKPPKREAPQGGDVLVWITVGMVGVTTLLVVLMNIFGG